MTIIGIDPGYAIVGYGVLHYEACRFKPLAFGAITTEPDMPFEKRLAVIYGETSALLGRWKPDAMSIEQLFFNNNKTTGIGVAQGRGVILLAAAQNGVPIAEYSPQQVKLAVVGYGKAEKRQVMELTRQILGLQSVPKPDDTADALALAVCHAHSSGSRLGALQALACKRK